MKGRSERVSLQSAGAPGRCEHCLTQCVSGFSDFPPFLLSLLLFPPFLFPFFSLRKERLSRHTRHIGVRFQKKRNERLKEKGLADGFLSLQLSLEG
jgi:hypothetical protein